MRRVLHWMFDVYMHEYGDQARNKSLVMLARWVLSQAESRAMRRERER
jgi:hypothetical protein